MKTIRFTKKAAGREAGVEETWADETQAQAFIDAGVAEEIETDVDDAAPAKGLDRALRGRGER